MTAILHHTARIPTTATASSAAASYPATHVLLPQVLREWRSTTTGASWVQIDLGASLPVEAVAINAFNCASCTVLADNSATPTTNRGTLTTGIDHQGRRKGALAFSATVRYIRFNITGGSPTDGAAFWRAGSAFVFVGSLALPRDPLYGSSSIDWITPQQRNDLPNGRAETWSTGAACAELGLLFAGRETDDVEALQRYARAGACWFDYGIAADRGLQFPVVHCEGVTTMRFEKFNRRMLETRLREVA